MVSTKYAPTMRTSCIALIALASVALPRPATATSCAGGGSIATAHRLAAAVFVATVERVEPPKPVVTTEPDGSVTGSVTSGPDTVGLAIQDVFKGAVQGRIRLTSDFRFAENERYLIYADDVKGTITVSICSRTRPLSEAAEDLKFMDGRRRSMPQGVLWGLVLQDGKNPGPVEIVALRNGVHHRIASQGDGYHVVLSPGRYLVWAERDGRTLVDPETIEIRDGEETMYVISFAGER